MQAMYIRQKNMFIGQKEYIGHLKKKNVVCWIKRFDPQCRLAPALSLICLNQLFVYQFKVCVLCIFVKAISWF